MSASHFDGGKPRVEFLPPAALLQISEVFTYGASKYDDFNWRKGMPWLKLYASTIRHLLAWAMREDIDKESGLPHLAHAGANVLMLIDYSIAALGEDNRQ